MNTMIKSKRLKSDELANLLENLSSHFKYLIVSDWQEIRFVKFDPKDSVILNSYNGRAFGNNSELRWRRDQDNSEFICRWISDDGICPQGDGWKPLPPEELSQLKPTEKNTGYLLWGELLRENNEDFWYQARIPKKLKYPINEKLSNLWKDDDKTPLVLYVREYKHNGRTMFDRFIKLGRYGEEM